MLRWSIKNSYRTYVQLVCNRCFIHIIQILERKINLKTMSSVKETESNQQHIDLQSAYPWIDAGLFKEMLHIDFPTDEIVVQNYCLKAALACGENYGSQMIRAKVNFMTNGANKEINFIIKTTIASEGFDEGVAKERYEVFYKEIAVYEKVLPKVRDLLKTIGDKTKLHGRCYAMNTEKPYLIFEDLSAGGYTNVDRRNGLNIEHYKLVLATAAKYHAATAVIVEKDPSLKMLFNEHPTTSGSMFLRKMIQNFLIAEIEFCKTQPGLEKVGKKLANIKDSFFDRISASCVRDEDDFNVILHGDLWANNIMFKYDDNGEIEDTVLVDFQLCSYGPPALDVTYCLYTSTDDAISEVDWDMLVQHYYDELRIMLKTLNYSKKVLSLMEFNAQIIMRGMYASSLGIICEAGRILENVGKDGVTNFIVDDAAEYRLNMLLNPKIEPKIVKLLKYFDRKGYYDNDVSQY